MALCTLLVLKSRRVWNMDSGAIAGSARYPRGKGITR